MHDTAIEELEQENRLLRARNDRQEAEAREVRRLWAKEVDDTRLRVAREAIERLEQGGQTAAVSLLRHYFFGATNG